MKQFNNPTIKRMLSFTITLLLIVSELIAPMAVYSQTATDSAVPQSSLQGETLQPRASESATLEFIENASLQSLEGETLEPQTLEPQPDLTSPSVSSAELRLPPKIRKLLKKTFKMTEKAAITVQNADVLEIDAKLTYSDGSIVDAETQEIKKGENTEIRITPPQSLKPGKYKLTVRVNGQELEEEFFWGVLAINTNKSIYIPEETANLAIAVLDERGDMVCDAKLELRITRSHLARLQGETLQPQTLEPQPTEILSTENGKIKASPTCTQKALIMEPDYSASYTVGDAGTYTMSLSATTNNGNYSIEDSFEVRDSVDFDIERISATRIYPPETYPVTFKIKANRDFEGTVSEIVPDTFGIFQQERVLQYRETRVSDSQTLEKEEVLGDRTIGYPFEGEEPITLGFGEPLRDPRLKKIYYDLGIAGHDGIDFGLPEGTEVIAVDNGKIVMADTGGPYGSTIVIEHSWGKSYYGHLSEFVAKKDQEVVRGEKIALSGSTGLSLGPHLHFGIKLNKNFFENGYYGKTNPAPFLGITSSSDVLGTSTYKLPVQIITWDLSVKKGEEVTFGYKFKSPEISPQLYKLGPLRFYQRSSAPALSSPNGPGSAPFSPVFEEARQWKLAIDAPNNKFVKQGSFAASTGVNSQSITGVGFKPRAIIFYWTNQTADGTASPGNGVANSFGMGFLGTNPSVGGLALSFYDEAENAPGATDTGRTQDNESIIIQGNSGSIVAAADITSVDPDGFSISWSNQAESAYIIHYQAFSETIISNVAVGSFNFAQGTGNLSVNTGLGFQPDFVMFMTGGLATSSANFNQGVFSIGAATSSTSQWAIGIKAEHNSDSSDTCTIQDTTNVIYMISNKTGALDTQDCTTIAANRGVADFTQFTGNGFDINKSTSPAETFDVNYLALKSNGASFTTGSFNTPGGAAGGFIRQTVSNSFLPAGIFFADTANAGGGIVGTLHQTGTSDGLIALGSTSGPNQESSFGLAGESNIDNYSPSMRMLRTKGFLGITGNTDSVFREINLKSFNIDSFTLDWTTSNDGNQAQLYWAIGEILEPVDLMRHGKWFNNGSEQSFAF